MAFAFLQATSNVNNLTTYTFASQNIGTADAGRYIIVGVNARAAAGTTLDSVTVGGVSATIVRQQSNSGNLSALAIAAVPTGTTGDVVLTFAAQRLRCRIQLWRAVGISSATPHDVDSNAATDPSVSLDVPAGGFAIGTACTDGAVGPATWTGLTEVDDTHVESSLNCTAASDEFVGAQTGLTITADFSVTGSGTGVFASWAPSGGGGGTILPFVNNIMLAG